MVVPRDLQIVKASILLQLLHFLHHLWMYLSSSGILSFMTDPTFISTKPCEFTRATNMHVWGQHTLKASQTPTRVSGRVEISLELCTLQWICGWAECSVGQKGKVRVREKENNSDRERFSLALIYFNVFYYFWKAEKNVKLIKGVVWGKWKRRVTFRQK